MNKKIVFLDLDGVIANMVSAALNLFRIKDYEIPNGQFEITKWPGVNLSSNKFWKKIDEAGHNFWAQIEPYDYADELVNFLNENYDLFILSSPSKSPFCSSGKMDWIKKHYPFLLRKTILTPRKELLAAENRFLIDDSEHKTRPFNEMGGFDILFPQPWNKNYSIFYSKDYNALDYVKSKLF